MRLSLLLMTFFSALICGVTSTTVFAKHEMPTVATIGFTPGDDPEWLKKNGVELAKALQEKLQTPVNIYISKDYGGLVQAMKDKKVDFAFFSALTFVDAEKKADAKVLLKKVWDGPYYYSAVITTKNSRIKTIDGLKGKSFGYVDEQSASGHLYPEVMLMKKGKDLSHFFKETKYFGTHENAVKALLAGEVDAVAVYANDAKGKTGAWDKFAPKEAKNVKVIWVSEPIPNDPFCVRQDFYERYPHFTHNMMFALIDFQDEPPEKNLLKSLYGISSMMPATSRQYDPVRELVKYQDMKKTTP